MRASPAVNPFRLRAVSQNTILIFQPVIETHKNAAKRIFIGINSEKGNADPVWCWKKEEGSSASDLAILAAWLHYCGHFRPTVPSGRRCHRGATRICTLYEISVENTGASRLIQTGKNQIPGLFQVLWKSHGSLSSDVNLPA